MKRWLLAPILVATVLCLWDLGGWPLWLDEIFCANVARLDVAGIVNAAAKDRHPPLSFLLMALATHIRDTEAFLRLPAALSAILSVAVVGWTLHHHISPRAGQIAAWIMAFSPVVLLHAHSARMYTLLLLWGALLLWGGLELIRGSARRGALLLVIAGTLGLYTHYAAGFVLASVAMGVTIGLGLDRPSDARSRGLLLLAALALITVLFLPWAQGPLRFQLASKDTPAERTFGVLRFLFWSFDNRVPVLSLVLVGLQLGGLGLMLRRREGITGLILGYVLGVLIFPYFASDSEPAQMSRNYLGFLPACLLLIASLAQRAGVVGPVVGLGLLAAPSLWDLARRPASPQELGTGFDHGRTAQVLDTTMAPDAPVRMVPAWLPTKYRRYTDAFQPRAKLDYVPGGWQMISRSAKADAPEQYAPDCVFSVAFGEIVFAPADTCATLEERIRAQAGIEAEGYAPFLLEIATRELRRKRWEEAATWARAGTAACWWHPSGFLLLAEAEAGRAQWAAAADAAWSAWEVARDHDFPVGVQVQALRLHARAAEALGDPERAAESRARAACVKAGTPLWRCSGDAPEEPEEPSAEPAPSGEAPSSEAPPSAASPSAAGVKCPQSTCTPSPTPPATPAVSWSLESLDGWLLSKASTTAGVLSLTDSACSPLTPAAPQMALWLRWRAVEVGANGAVIIEARHADATGAMLKAGNLRLLQSSVTGDWRGDQLQWIAPEGAAQVRICVRTRPDGPARAEIDALALSHME